ncbi:initiator tRNA phosphoribosyl transferase [Lichtheimia hyalospora FSU 10163]|nr:initiator tRNA phosphoribosyl transferase [Lichtheimia hyalospora FSU 10163]
MRNLFENEYHDGANQIRKDHKNILNRLRSIEEDAAFVKEIAALFPSLPLVANERCGSWYIDPTEHKVHSVYFKSTDGHMGQWDFNMRRSNMHLVDIIGEYGGCIIVDSTRRGKRIPDSLSKTIPIWCSTFNRAIAKHCNLTWDTGFHSLPSAVSRSEHAQIEARIDEFAQRLLRSGTIDMDRIASMLKKPLRPLWYTPQSSIFINDLPNFEQLPFTPVICLSASQAVESGCQARPGYLYVQGSGDDQEAWCHGLTPRLFWQHRALLLGSGSAAECEKHARQLARSNDMEDDNSSSASSDGTTFNYIGQTNIAIGSRLSALFESIPTALDFAHDHLVKHRRILIHCAKGQDRSVGIALAILVKYFDLQVNKEIIQEHLMRIISSRPKASPSRATLKKVNTYFMS